MASANLIGKTCLVTGASGFIGSHLCQELAKQGANVKALLHSEASGIWDTSVVCELGQQKIPGHVMQGVDVVFHLAGRAHSLADRDYQEQEYFQTNVEGTRSLLEAARNASVKKLIFFSSVKSMGEECEYRLDETYKPNPTTTYGKTKLEAEQLVLNGGFVTVPIVLRLVMVYGDSEKGNLPKMIRAIWKNRFPPFPKVQNKRSMIHVDDVVLGAIQAAKSDISAGETYILSDGIDYSTRQLYENICETLEKRIPLWSVPKFSLVLLAKIGDLFQFVYGRRIFFDSDNLQKLFGDSYYSSEKIIRDLGFSPKHTLFSALPNIISNMNLK